MNERIQRALDSLCVVVRQILAHSPMSQGLERECRGYLENIRLTLEVEADQPLIKVPTPALPPDDKDRCSTTRNNIQCRNERINDTPYCSEHHDSCDFGPAPEPESKKDYICPLPAKPRDDDVAVFPKSRPAPKPFAGGCVGTIPDLSLGDPRKYKGAPKPDSPTCPARVPVTYGERSRIIDAIVNEPGFASCGLRGIIGKAITATERKHGIKP